MVRIPGVFWLALIAFITEWLPRIVDADAPWLPQALLVLLALAKAVEVIVAPTYSTRSPETQWGKLMRWLIG